MSGWERTLARMNWSSPRPGCTNNGPVEAGWEEETHLDGGDGGAVPGRFPLVGAVHVAAEGAAAHGRPRAQLGQRRRHLVELAQELADGRYTLGLEVVYPLRVDGDADAPGFGVHAEGRFEQVVPMFRHFTVDAGIGIL